MHPSMSALVKQRNSVKHFSFNVSMMLSLFSRGHRKAIRRKRIPKGHGGGRMLRGCEEIQEKLPQLPAQNTVPLVTSWLVTFLPQKPEPLPPVLPAVHGLEGPPWVGMPSVSPLPRSPVWPTHSESLLPPGSPCTTHHQLAITRSPDCSPQGYSLLAFRPAPVLLSQPTSLLSAIWDLNPLPSLSFLGSSPSVLGSHIVSSYLL